MPDSLSLIIARFIPWVWMPVDITEVFAQDTKVKVRIAQCFDPASAVNSFRSATEAYNAAVSSFRSATEAYDAALESAKAKDSVAVTEEDTTSGFIVNSNECQEIEDRCNEIRQGKLELDCNCCHVFSS